MGGDAQKQDKPVVITAVVDNLFRKASTIGMDKIATSQDAYNNLKKQGNKADAKKFYESVVDKALSIAEIKEVEKQYHVEGGKGFFGIETKTIK